MMAVTTRDKLEFVHAMARNTRATVRQCEALMRFAATLQRLAEDDCNIPMNDEQRTRWIRKQERIQMNVIAITAELELDLPIFSSDPRGAVLKIRVPSGYSDDMGGEGICVPSLSLWFLG